MVFIESRSHVSKKARTKVVVVGVDIQSHPQLSCHQFGGGQQNGWSPTKGHQSLQQYGEKCGNSVQPTARAFLHP